MAAKLPLRTLMRPSRLRKASIKSQLSFSTSVPQLQEPSKAQPSNHDRYTHFGFENVKEEEKAAKVGAVFSSVASSYDRMNDLMSLGIHRLWKDHFVRSLNPGFSPTIPASSSSSSSSSSQSPNTPPPPPPPAGPPGYKILDVAGGTGDIAFRLLHHAHHVNHSPNTTCTISDISPAMLAEGRKRSLSTPWANKPQTLSFLAANAEDLRAAGVADHSIDLYTVAFGIRNFTDKRAALREAFRVLRPGGVFACLEFSRVRSDRFPLLEAAYKRWSFAAIPLIGQLVAGDRASYQYLVESIERFPDQEQWRDMIAEAGFVVPGGDGEGWEDLSGGIAAIHKGIKPAGAQLGVGTHLEGSVR